MPYYIEIGANWRKNCFRTKEINAKVEVYLKVKEINAIGTKKQVCGVEEDDIDDSTDI